MGRLFAINLIWTDLLIAKSQFEKWLKKLQQSESVSSTPRKDDWFKPKGETQRAVREKDPTFMILYFKITSKQFSRITNFLKWSLNLDLEDLSKGLGTWDKSLLFSDFYLSLWESCEAKVTEISNCFWLIFPHTFFYKVCLLSW